MSTSAAGGGPGPGPGSTFKSVQSPVKQPGVALAVMAGATLVYAFWELRVRASQRLGKTPRTINKEWQDAEAEHLRHMNFESNPSKHVYMNPFYHTIPHSRYLQSD